MSTRSDDSLLGGSLCILLLGGSHQGVGDRFHDRLLVRAEVAPCLSLELPRHHIPNHLLHCPGPLIGQDVRQLVNDYDIAPFHKHVLPKLELRFKEFGADLSVTFCSSQLGLVRRANGPGAETHPSNPGGEPLLEPLRGLELTAPGSSFGRFSLC